MSVEYSVAVNIGVPFCEETIKCILQKGVNLGFVYYFFILGTMTIDSEPLDVEAATRAVIIGDSESDLHALTIQIEDTYTDLLFVNSGDQLVVMFCGLGCGWSKTFYNDYSDLDMARYGKAMLDFVSDFKIVNMVIEKD